MRALRIKLTQTSANYRKEESDRNRMTYPLPPVSTVIGAIHKACSFTAYMPMKVSIQGKFKSMHKEPYTDYCFLNTVFDDRGILVKVNNSTMLSSGFAKVASAKKSMGNSFKKKITIDVHNEELLEEYISLGKLRDEINNFKKNRIKPCLDLIKKRKKSLADKKKKLEVKSPSYHDVVQRELELKSLEKEINDCIKEYEKSQYEEPYSRFKSLTTSLKYYEILDDIELILHITASDEVLELMEKNIYNLKSIGRSEDFVDIKDAKLVDLYPCDEDISNEYSAYLNYEDIVNENIVAQSTENSQITGTVYYLNTNYQFVDEGKRLTRKFNKCKAIYTSYYEVFENSKNIWVDKCIEKDESRQYIVNFLTNIEE